MKTELLIALACFAASPAFASSYVIHCTQLEPSQLKMTVDATLDVAGPATESGAPAGSLDLKGNATVVTSPDPWNETVKMAVDGVYVPATADTPLSAIEFRTTANDNEYYAAIFSVGIKATDPNYKPFENQGNVNPSFYKDGVRLTCSTVEK